jgi:hypothetical protein
MKKEAKKKGMYEKAPVDGKFLANQTLKKGKFIKRYHSW